MRAMLIVLLTTLVGCGSGNVCNRAGDLRTDCDDPPSEAALASCRTTIRDCAPEQVDLLEEYLDCLSDGVEDGECYVANPEDPSTDPTAGCFENVLVEADSACVGAVTSL